MSPLSLIIIYSCFIIAASMLGGWLPSLIRLTHTRVQLMMSLVGGLMLGIAIYHLLPHALLTLSGDQAAWWMMIGLLLTFFMIRAFHSHEHGVVDEEGDADEQEHHHAPHDEHCDHHHEITQSKNPYHWIGVAFGLSLHTLLDGVVVAAAVMAEEAHGGEDGVMWLLGFGPFLGVLFHKPLDSLSITSLMITSGWKRQSRQLVNVAYASMCPLGALLFYATAGQILDDKHLVIGCALAFSAGVFLCIALADLLPELQFHSHDRWKLSCALLLGVVLAYGIRYLEPEHAHDHGDSGKGQEKHEEHKGHKDHGHHDHDH